MTDVNLFDTPRSADEGEPPGYGGAYARIGPLVGARDLGLTVYELAEGISICPYHYEYPCEEWLIVLEGQPVSAIPTATTTWPQATSSAFHPGRKAPTRSPTAHPPGPSWRCSRPRKTPASSRTPTATSSASTPEETASSSPAPAAVDYWTCE